MKKMCRKKKIILLKKKKRDPDDEYFFDPADQNYLLQKKEKKLKDFKNQKQKEIDTHMKDKEELLKKIQLLEQNMLSDYNIQPISDQEKKEIQRIS